MMGKRLESEGCLSEFADEETKWSHGLGASVQ